MVLVRLAIRNTSVVVFISEIMRIIPWCPMLVCHIGTIIKLGSIEDNHINALVPDCGISSVVSNGGCTDLT